MSLLDAIMKPQEKTIRIACEGSIFVRLEELNELQSYKNLTDEAYQKAKTSILELGFSFPIFVWENEGKMWIIDAHQRKRVLTRLRDVEGYIIPPLPAVRIHAKDKTEAKKKILAQESQYGDITQEGLYEFMNEEGFELDATELETFVDIDEFDWEQEAQDFSDKNKEIDPEEIAKDLNMKCPKCGFEFKGDKGLTQDAQVPVQMESE